MRTWNLKFKDPYSITIAADGRFGETNYLDDQIWEFLYSSGDPSALAVYTTYGLRAKSMRLFPRFTLGNKSVINPDEFDSKIEINIVLPNYLKLAFSPFRDIDVIAEYWVPGSNSIVGRLSLANRGDELQNVQVDWIAQLAPHDGQPMTPVSIEAAPVLAGKTQMLHPLIFITAGPQPGKGSYPSLFRTYSLEPGDKGEFYWIHCAKYSIEDSFARAREIANLNFSAEIAALEMQNSSIIDIYTGESDWDAVFAFSQLKALGTIQSSTSELPQKSFVLDRTADEGFSLQGDGKDYLHLWCGQSPIEAYYLALVSLPGTEELLRGIIKNYLAVQEPDGFIDMKPGLGGQRSRLLATPIITSLAWKIYEYNQDISFLEEIFTPLYAFFSKWFTPERDRDGDGIPEWDHLLQTGLDTHPIYARSTDNSLGVNIFTSESHALCSFLYREAYSLIKIAEILNHSAVSDELESKMGQLENSLVEFWDAEIGAYQNRDRDSHLISGCEKLFSITGPGVIQVDQVSGDPIRVLIHIQSGKDRTVSPDIHIYGTSASGKNRIERVTGSEFKWHLGRGSYTGERVYSTIERIEVKKVDPDDHIEVYKLGFAYLDVSTFLPLWAHCIQANKAAVLVKNTMQNKDMFWHEAGLPMFCNNSHLFRAIEYVNPLWNSLAIEGLLRYGYQEEASALMSKLLTTIANNLKREQAFRMYYLAENGKGTGEANILNGLAPVELFLESLGLRIISSREVKHWGINPYPWPVTIKYKGLTIIRYKVKSLIIFPDGQTIEVQGSEYQLIREQ